MTKKVAISQSNYIPWKGYFDLIASVDVFVLYDDMQYTKNDWRNRNKIKTSNGSVWLTIPVDTKGKLSQKISDAKISNNIWKKKHWTSICQSYAKSPYFEIYKDELSKLYLEHDSEFLSEINLSFIKFICNILGIKTELICSSKFNLVGDKSEKVLGICKDLNADVYISGPAAKDYLDVELFSKEGITVKWMEYAYYPEYSQQYPPFEHYVTVLDLIFNEGSNARNYMRNYMRNSDEA